MDHDQHFKTVIQTFFPEFIELFFREWLERIDVRKIHWLEQETFPNPPEGTRHALDLIGEAKLKKPIPDWDGPPVKKSLILIHIEVESDDSTSDIRARMPFYYFFLRQKHQLPILPIVLFLQVGLDGLGELQSSESLFGFEVLKFRYHYIGLPTLNAIEYLQGENPLGFALSALMKMPKNKIVEWGAQALLKITQANTTEQGRYLLGRIVENYLPLGAKEQREMAKLLEREEYREVKAMNLSSYEKGEQAGFEKGKRLGLKEGAKSYCLRMIEKKLRVKFRKSAGKLLEQIRQIDDLSRLEFLFEQLETVESLEEFQALLDQ